MRACIPGSGLRLSANVDESKNGAGARNRTRDLRFTKPLLYLLSYTGLGSHYSPTLGVRIRQNPPPNEQDRGRQWVATSDSDRNMRTLLEQLRGSVTGKIVFIGALILVLSIPIGMIEGLIRERMHRYTVARDAVAVAWGRSQTIGGPILALPFRYTRMTYGEPAIVRDEVYVLPQSLTVTANVDAQSLKRGIYTVPVYTARLHVIARFAPPAIEGAADDVELLWSEAHVALPVSDARSIKEPVQLTSTAGSAPFQPGGVRVPGFGPQLVADASPLGSAPTDAAQIVSFDLVIGGTGSLDFLPLGDATRVSLTANWPSPRFSGAYLPDERSVSTAGFSAEWRVLSLGRGYPSVWKKSEPPPAVEVGSFGVELIDPVGVHEASLRAAKYAVLVIGFTFAAYFLFEVLAGLRLHAVQYLAIGLANCVFYLLLLALAEQVGFALAYAGSAIAATTLIGTYSAAVLQSARRALPVTGLLGAIYAYLYVTLEAEDFALLIGAIGTFVLLATFMYLTRRVDWSAVRFAEEPAADAERSRVQLHA